MKEQSNMERMGLKDSKESEERLIALINFAYKNKLSISEVINHIEKFYQHIPTKEKMFLTDKIGELMLMSDPEGLQIAKEIYQYLKANGEL